MLLVVIFTYGEAIKADAIFQGDEGWYTVCIQDGSVDGLQVFAVVIYALRRSLSRSDDIIVIPVIDEQKTTGVHTSLETPKLSAAFQNQAYFSKRMQLSQDGL